MKCKYLGCDNEAEENYPCCDFNHGIALRTHLNLLPSLFQAKNQNKAFREWITVAEVEYYSNLKV